MKLKLVVPTTAGHKAEVYLDDKRLSLVTGVLIEVNVEQANHAQISFYPSEIEFEGEFKEERIERRIPLPFTKEVSHA